jgi:hypothetical protein
MNNKCGESKQQIASVTKNKLLIATSGESKQQATTNQKKVGSLGMGGFFIPWKVEHKMSLQMQCHP